MPDRSPFVNLPPEELIALLEDGAKNWLAMDGLWFLAVEERFGLETAIALDRAVWERFSPIEARRIMARHGIAPAGGLPALAAALRYRLYAHLNEHELEWTERRMLVLKVKTCRVHAARERDGRPPFPCCGVGLVEYTAFAQAIDPRIRTRCLGCPPHRPEGAWCAWEFSTGEVG